MGRGGAGDGLGEALLGSGPASSPPPPSSWSSPFPFSDAHSGDYCLHRCFATMEWSPEEVAAVREATPGNVIHLNNAGCSLPTQRTLDTVIDYLNREALHGG